VEDNIIPIKPQHVIAQLKFAGVTSSHASKSPQSGIARSRRLPGAGSSSPGWETKSVDRFGFPALTVGGNVQTPAEAVKLSYNTKGYNHHQETRDRETPVLMEHLTNAGFTVVPFSDTKFAGGRPQNNVYLVYKKA
jgi:hypothetical protein